MDYKKLIEKLRFPTWYDLEEPDSTLLADAATAITALLARAEKAERERDAAYEAIKELIEEEDLPVAICREICENHDGMCCERAQIGIWDTCRGFKPRGQKEE